MTEAHTTEMLLAAIGALAAVVGFLYRQMQIHYTETQSKLNDCERDRLDLWKEVAAVRGLLKNDETAD